MITNKHTVNNAPGQTAHWHNVQTGRRVRQSWCYAAFERAENAGLIEGEWVGNRRVYFITEKGLGFLEGGG